MIRRPTVYLDRSIVPFLEAYLTDGVPAGALARVLVEWGVALMDEAPVLPEAEARALLAIAREWRPRPRAESGEPRVALEVASIERAILDEGAFAGVPEDIQQRLLDRLGTLSPVERLGLLLKLAWACEAMNLLPGMGRRPLSLDEALRVARLAVNDA